MDIRRSDLKMYARRALKGNWVTVTGAILIIMGIIFLFAAAMQAILFFTLGRDFYAMHGAHFGAGRIFWKGTQPLRPGMVIAALVLGILCFVYIIILFLAGAGYGRILLDIAAGRKARIRSLFWGFTHKPWKFILISLLFALLTGAAMIPICVLTAAAALTGESRFAAFFLIFYCAILLVVFAYAALTFSQFYLILIEDTEKGIFEAFRESFRMMKGNRCRYLVLCLSFFGINLLGVLSCGLASIWIAPYMGCTLVFFYLALKERQRTSF